MTTERLVKIGDMTFALAVLVALTVPAAAGNCLYSSSQYCSCVRAQVVHPRARLVGLVMLCVAGSLITKLAKTYGIEKTGWLGVGAKSMLAVLAMSWVVVGVIALWHGYNVFAP
jgi:hypothetical protein